MHAYYHAQLFSNIQVDLQYSSVPSLCKLRTPDRTPSNSWHCMRPLESWFHPLKYVLSAAIATFPHDFWLSLSNSFPHHCARVFVILEMSKRRSVPFVLRNESAIESVAVMISTESIIFSMIKLLLWACTSSFFRLRTEWREYPTCRAFLAIHRRQKVVEWCRMKNWNIACNRQMATFERQIWS